MTSGVQLGTSKAAEGKLQELSLCTAPGLCKQTTSRSACFCVWGFYVMSGMFSAPTGPRKSSKLQENPRQRPEGQKVICKANACWNFSTCWKDQQRGAPDRARRHVLEDGLIFHSVPITQQESKDGSPPSRERYQPDRTALDNFSLTVAAASQGAPFPCPLCTL